MDHVEMIMHGLKTFLVIIVLCFVLFSLQNNLFSYSFSVPSSFTRQDIKDPILDWIDVDNRTGSHRGDPSTDITEVTYFSDGMILNSTIWLLFPFKVSAANYELFNYGIMIDSDLNNETGPSGIDYQLEVRWNNTAKNWERVLTEWSSVGGKTIEKTRNFTGFSKNQSYYVLLSLNLNEILNPERFRAIFYAESKMHNGHLLTDFTKWVFIPPPSVQISSSPPSVTMKQGEKRTIELIINSTPTLEPDIVLSNLTKDQSADLDLEFSTLALKVPSDGVATIPVTVGTSEKTSVAPHTIHFFAYSSFPSLEFLHLPTQKTLNTGIEGAPFKLSVESDLVKTRSSLLINVEPAHSLLDQVGDFWDKLGGPISFIYGIAAGLSPWLFTTIKNRLTKKGIDKKE